MSSIRIVGPSAFQRIALACCLTLLASLPTTAGQAAEPRTVEAAEQMLEVSGADRIFEAMWQQMAPMMKSSFINKHPGKEKDVDALMSAISQEFKIVNKDLKRKLSEKYADSFSYDEIIYLMDFYKTPVGMKLVIKQPAIMAEIIPFSTEMGKQVMISVAKNHPKLLENLTR
jgi:hypothetical protein